MKWKKSNRQVLCLLSLMLFVSSCVPTSRNRISNSTGQPEKELTAPKVDSNKQESKPAEQIIFITMSMAQDSQTGTRVIEVQEVVKTPGTLKIRPKDPVGSGPYLSCIFYADQIRLDSLHLEHPLYQQLEYVNEKKQFARKAVKLDQAEFFIRFQQSGANLLKIEERLPDALPKELITIKF
jgi:hypothetical protein